MSVNSVVFLLTDLTSTPLLLRIAIARLPSVSEINPESVVMVVLEI